VTSALKVLVVEDDDSLRELYTQLLTADGHEVRLASDGLEALAKFDGGIDLIITDLNMPTMSGDVFLLELRNARRLQNTPVLVITAFPEDLPGTLRMPQLTVLRKPFELDVFTKYVVAAARERAGA